MEQYLFFDLDGTLTDSAEGIVNCVIYALEKMGIRENDREKLLAFVGPPLIDSFAKYYGMTEEEAKKATEFYRERFREKGWCENRVYPGIPEVLEELKKKGCHLLVATSKPEVFARRIVTHFGLEPFFEFVGGSTMDGRISRKGDVIRYVLEQTGRECREQVIMVGDREHDVMGAAEHGLPCIGVLYGYGSRRELLQAGARWLCSDTAGLPETADAAFREINGGMQ